MKLLISLAFVCALFYKAFPLQCNMCTLNTAPCTTTPVPCPANQTRCASATVLSTVGGNQTTLELKTCATPDLCISGSVNLRATRYTVNTLCCDTDLCNTQSPPALYDGSQNGRECFTCVENNCTHKLQCLGAEDRCISSSVTAGGQTTTVKGCATRTVCAGDLKVEIGTVASLNLTCCEGNLCNNALPVEQSFLLLLVSLASFILLY
ncbi:hypothetical protein MATL_G00183210 [Megalops atlanticus]|uniref:UPAR/Ly6 domain-containing protein n=1 Tax=Megalops atlanticus TaxID=7932 RepID=A0A9D3T6K9_MEGAT|nr:hypothetical protein MATL_G00183210 [Megalops atlanticus]